MKTVIFYEKPCCINNTKQKAMLVAAGHEVIARNLLKTPWTRETLRPFFGDLPVREWFNYSAHRIKVGEIMPEQLDESTALEFMLAEPLLIRRPLMQVGEVFMVGFNIEKVEAWIGLSPIDNQPQDIETCPRSHETTPCKSPV